MISTASVLSQASKCCFRGSEAGTEKKSDRPIVPMLMPIAQEYRDQRFFVRTLVKAGPHKLED
jgi:hypothetical protein